MCAHYGYCCCCCHVQMSKVSRSVEGVPGFLPGPGPKERLRCDPCRLFECRRSTKYVFAKIIFSRPPSGGHFQVQVALVHAGFREAVVCKHAWLDLKNSTALNRSMNAFTVSKHSREDSRSSRVPRMGGGFCGLKRLCAVSSQKWTPWRPTEQRSSNGR